MASPYFLQPVGRGGLIESLMILSCFYFYLLQEQQH